MFGDSLKMTITIFMFGVLVSLTSAGFWLSALQHRDDDLNQRLAVVEQFLAVGGAY
jgi:hypothetical protein